MEDEKSDKFDKFENNENVIFGFSFYFNNEIKNYDGEIKDTNELVRVIKTLFKDDYPSTYN